MCIYLKHSISNLKMMFSFGCPRVEKCFKKAIESEEVDAETYSKYAVFQWKVLNDLWAAEENFLEAISADPTNSFYAANYANFLWQTGGEETCYPLESSDSPQ